MNTQQPEPYPHRIAREKGYHPVREGYRVQSGDVTLGAAVTFLDNEIEQYSKQELHERARLRRDRGEYEVTFDPVPTWWIDRKVGEDDGQMFIIFGVFRKKD